MYVQVAWGVEGGGAPFTAMSLCAGPYYPTLFSKNGMFGHRMMAWGVEGGKAPSAYSPISLSV